MSEPAARAAVVIVNYNAGDWLMRCLESLRSHRGQIDLDVVVVDNASTDGSDSRAAAGHPWVRFVRNQNNVYLSPAWNAGARATSAPYLLFLNPDAEILKGTLAEFVQVAEDHPRAGVLGPMVRNLDGSVYPSGRTLPSVTDAVGHAFLSPFTRNNRFTRRHEMDGWDRTTEREVDWVSGCCMLMPRAAFDEVDGFDEGFLLYGEELDIATRLRARGWSVLFTPQIEVAHALGISTGGDRRPHHIMVMHSQSLFRYYRLHRARGWRRVTLPFAWVALRLRAEVAWLWGRLAKR